MKNSFQPTDKNAFSLVELSIVLVILGLLVGGILSGQSLIRAAEMRSVNTEYQRYAAAVSTFRDKYFALPGDMSNATSFWTAGTANGDGNGQILGSAPTVAATNETGHFWAQLGLAGLVEGSYTPASWASPVLGTTTPRGKLSSSGWNMRWVGTVANDDITVGTTGAGTNIMYEGNYGNAFFLMSAVTLAAPTAAGGLLRAEEAWNIDTKMDDGKPATGSVTSLEIQGAATPNGCANAAGSTSATAGTVAYDLANTNATECSLVFKSGY
jgi:prepilin-type N-terminal cleavage/methylation domain-containing protein